jgi:hypothetical protein
MKGLTAIPAQHPAHYMRRTANVHAPASILPHMHPIAPRSALSDLAHTMLTALPPFTSPPCRRTPPLYDAPRS